MTLADQGRMQVDNSRHASQKVFLETPLLHVCQRVRYEMQNGKLGKVPGYGDLNLTIERAALRKPQGGF